MKKYPYICPDKTELKGQYDEAQVVHSKNGIFARRRGRWVMLVVRFNWKGLPPPPHAHHYILIYSHLHATSSDYVSMRALPFAGRGYQGGKQPFIWVLGKNRFIRAAASVASHG